MGKIDQAFSIPRPIIRRVMLAVLLCFCMCVTVNLHSQAFVTTWETTAPNESITIPTTGSGYNYMVAWGDGNVTSGHMGNASHSYDNPGIYTIAISGDFPRIYFNDEGDKDKIRSIEAWGDIEWNDLHKAFFGACELEYHATDAPDLSNATSMSGMFMEAFEAVNFNKSLTVWNWIKEVKRLPPC